jgi:hypothetical protein
MLAAARGLSDTDAMIMGGARRGMIA